MNKNNLTYQQKKQIAKGLNIFDLCDYLGLKVRKTGNRGILIDNTSVVIQDNGSSFRDFSTNTENKNSYGDVIDFWNYITHYEGLGYSKTVGFTEAMNEVFKIRCEIEPNCCDHIANLEVDNKPKVTLPEISPEQLNAEMSVKLKTELYGFDTTDPNYKKYIKRPKEWFKETYGVSKLDFFLQSVRNRYYHNLSGGVLGHDDYQAEKYGKDTNYLVGYLTNGRGISQETVDDFINLGYLVQTTTKWLPARNGAETKLEDGVSTTITPSGKTIVEEEGYMNEKYAFYPIQSKATWISYDNDGFLNSMWSRGFYNSASGLKPQFSYAPQERDKYSYHEKPFVFDPTHLVSANNLIFHGLLSDENIEPVKRDGVDTEKPVVVFESTIDLMSFYDLLKKTGQETDKFAYCSLNGAGKSIQGIEYVLGEFGYNKVIFALDKDQRGIEETKRAMKHFAEKGVEVRNICEELKFPKSGFEQIFDVKDFNEALQEYNKSNWEFPEISTEFVKEPELTNDEYDEIDYEEDYFTLC